MVKAADITAAFDKIRRELGEVVCAPGVEDASLLDAAFRADLAAFDAQSTGLAQRYRPS